MAIDAQSAASDWLHTFEQAFNAHDAKLVASLFGAEGSWRDVLAVSGQLRTCDTPDAIAVLLDEEWKAAPDRQVHIKSIWKAEQTERYGEHTIEAFFDFTTQVGKGKGIVRLRPDDTTQASLRAWMFFTSLHALELPPAEYSQPAPDSQATVKSDTRNWLDRREEETEYTDRDPTVLVVGAGQQGLSVAARLKVLNIDALVLERAPRIGDNWRKRYHFLRLHNDTRANHLPFLPFPPTWGRYTPKDQLADWFEFYAGALELNVWTNSEFVGASKEPDSGRWRVEVERRGQTRVLNPRHIIIATGVSGAPNLPQLPGLDRFSGPVMHTASYTVGRAFAGKRALVVGSGVSAHDVCQDLDRHGAAEIVMMQRSPTMVISVEPGCQELFSLYTKGDRPTEESDLINSSLTQAVQKRFMPQYYARIAQMDKPLLDGLQSVGFETNQTGVLGFTDLYRRRGGGYYMDIGCSQLIIDGRVEVLHARDFKTISEHGVVLADNTTREFDLIVLATGYKTLNDDVPRLFGDEIAQRIGPVWGLDDEGELRNIACRTREDGLWFLAGSFPDARINSHYLALQIQAAQAGVTL
jgi:cation diffusion facilitator CzcD-associated flavoprotein CzcO